jgi:hypothetical protein
MSSNVSRDVVLWTIYDHPSDFPDTLVARMFLNGVATETCIVNKSLGYLRVVIAHNYPLLRYFPRMPQDDPTIIETWF